MKHTLTIRSSGSSKAIVLNFVTLDYLSPGFHMIVPDSKNFETIRKARTICNFHTIVSIASKMQKTRGAWSSAMFLGRKMEFLRVIRKQAEYNDGF